MEQLCEDETYYGGNGIRITGTVTSRSRITAENDQDSYSCLLCVDDYLLSGWLYTDSRVALREPDYNQWTVLHVQG